MNNQNHTFIKKRSTHFWCKTLPASDMLKGVDFNARQNVNDGGCAFINAVSSLLSLS